MTASTPATALSNPGNKPGSLRIGVAAFTLGLAGAAFGTACSREAMEANVSRDDFVARLDIAIERTSQLLQHWKIDRPYPGSDRLLLVRKQLAACQTGEHDETDRCVALVEALDAFMKIPVEARLKRSISGSAFIKALADLESLSGYNAQSAGILFLTEKTAIGILEEQVDALRRW